MLATVSKALLSIGLIAAPLAAKVVRIDVHSRADIVNGRTYGTAGPNEKPFPQTASSPTSTRRPGTPTVMGSHLRSQRLAFISLTGDYRVQLVEPDRCDGLSGTSIPCIVNGLIC
jgi:hypothetical protein